MRRALITCPILFFVAIACGCESNKPPQTTRLQTSDIQQVTQEVTDKLATSAFMRERTSESPPIIITCRRTENLSHDLVPEPEQWMFVHKIETNINAGNFARVKNITFQIPPERVEMLRKKYPEIASGVTPATHNMTCSIRSADRVSNNKEGYVDNQTRYYYFDYNITRLSDGKVEWNGSAEFTRTAKGLVND